MRILKPIWGVIGIGSVVFPGAAYLLNLGSIKASPVGGFYPATAIPLGALAFTFTIFVSKIIYAEDKRGEAPLVSGCVVVCGGVIATLGLAGFIYYTSGRIQDARAGYVPISSTQCSFGFGGTLAHGEEVYKHQGFIVTKSHDCVWIGADRYYETNYREKSEIDKVEYVSLIIFNILFIALAVSFAAVGVEHRQSNNVRESV